MPDVENGSIPSQSNTVAVEVSDIEFKPGIVWYDVCSNGAANVWKPLLVDILFKSKYPFGNPNAFVGALNLGPSQSNSDDSGIYFVSSFVCAKVWNPSVVNCAVKSK